MKTICYTLILMMTFSTALLAGDDFEKEMDLGSFEKLYLKGGYEMKIKQGASNHIKITGDAKYEDEIEITVSDGVLSIITDEKNIKNHNITIYLDFKQLNEIEVLGALDLKSENEIKTGNLKLEFEGAGSVELDLMVDKLISEIEGVGSFKLYGDATYHKVNFSGVGSYDAKDLICEFASVESNGVGSVKVHASKKFIGDANGIGSVKYYGDPEQVKVSASGLGSVDRAN